MKMEIEIVTVKKKLTKSIVNQMLEIKFEEIEDVNVLGFAIGISPIKQKVLILEIDRFEYRIAYCNWKHWDTELTRPHRNRFTVEKIFKDKESCAKYYNTIEEFKKQAVQIYI